MLELPFNLSTFLRLLIASFVAVCESSKICVRCAKDALAARALNAWYPNESDKTTFSLADCYQPTVLRDIDSAYLCCCHRRELFDRSPELSLGGS